VLSSRSAPTHHRKEGCRRPGDGSIRRLRWHDAQLHTTMLNCIPVTAGWNYWARLYRPRKQILDGTYKFPEARPVG